MTKSEKLFWCAGFFDGEGCISMAKPKYDSVAEGKRVNGYQLQVIVAQRDRRPLDILVSVFGGNLHPSKANNGSTYWYWRLANQKALAMLQMLAPFLIIKQRGAELGIAFQEYLNDTRPLPSRPRTQDQRDLLDGFCDVMRDMNVRNRLMDYTVTAVQ